MYRQNVNRQKINNSIRINRTLQALLNRSLVETIPYPLVYE